MLTEDELSAVGYKCTAKLCEVSPEHKDAWERFWLWEKPGYQLYASLDDITGNGEANPVIPLKDFDVMGREDWLQAIDAAQKQVWGVVDSGPVESGYIPL